MNWALTKPVPESQTLGLPPLPRSWELQDAEKAPSSLPFRTLVKPNASTQSPNGERNRMQSESSGSEVQVGSVTNFRLTAGGSPHASDAASSSAPPAPTASSSAAQPNPVQPTRYRVVAGAIRPILEPPPPASPGGTVPVFPMDEEPGDVRGDGREYAQMPGEPVLQCCACGIELDNGIWCAGEFCDHAFCRVCQVDARQQNLESGSQRGKRKEPSELEKCMGIIAQALQKTVAPAVTTRSAMKVSVTTTFPTGDDDALKDVESWLQEFERISSHAAVVVVSNTLLRNAPC